MSMKERAGYYYSAGKSCAEALMLAAQEEKGMTFTDAEIVMMAGFGGGMGCKSTCGALTGAIVVLGKRFAGRDDIRSISAGFVELFTREMGCSSIECEVLEGRYRTPETRCVAAVEKTAFLLENYIDQLEGVDKTKNVDAAGCTLTPEEIKKVKAIGFLNHKGTNKFNARIITRNGHITGDEAIMMGEVANKYGDGHMSLTTRLTMEISGVDFADIDAFRQEVQDAGMDTGGTGSLVRPVVSCKGTTCQYGLYDTYKLSEEAHKRFYLGYRTVSLPHKFKIAFGGCPNNCVKPSLNDIGIIGARVPQYDESICKGCKKCQIEAGCPIKVAKVVDKKLVIDPVACNNCGRCIGKCPFHCIEDGQYGWKIFIGGRWGKKIAEGKMLNKLFTSEEEVMETIEKTILFFRSQGQSGERLADTVARVGFENAEAMILGNELLEKKAEIIGLNVVGGATC